MFDGKPGEILDGNQREICKEIPRAIHKRLPGQSNEVMPEAITWFLFKETPRGINPEGESPMECRKISLNASLEKFLKESRKESMKHTREGFLSRIKTKRNPRKVSERIPRGIHGRFLDGKPGDVFKQIPE